MESIETQNLREKLIKTMNVMDQIKEEIWVEIKDRFTIEQLDNLLKPKADVKQGV